MNRSNACRSPHHDQRVAIDPEPFLRIAFTHECLDAAVTSNLGNPFERALDQQIVLFDCASVRFADSSGIGMLIRLQSKYPGRVQLLNVQPGLRRCLAKVAKGLLPPERSEELLTTVPPQAGSATRNSAPANPGVEDTESIHPEDESNILPFAHRTLESPGWIPEAGLRSAHFDHHRVRTGLVADRSLSPFARAQCS